MGPASGEVELDAAALWRTVAGRMASHVEAGREHLLTEDVLRFATVVAIEEQGISPRHLGLEHLLPDKGKIDLVVGSPPTIAIEFKYPRDSRTGTSPDTMTTGEMLKDFYRLGDHAEIPERWAVVLLNHRLRRHLERRTDCRWTFDAGSVLRFHPDGHKLLPATAGAQLSRWSGATVEARCESAHQIGGLRLAAFRILDLPACTMCGSMDTIPIVYGYPGPEMMEEAQRGEVILGGCCVIEDQPNQECRACGAQFALASDRR